MFSPALLKGAPFTRADELPPPSAAGAVAADATAVSPAGKTDGASPASKKPTPNPSRANTRSCVGEVEPPSAPKAKKAKK